MTEASDLMECADCLCLASRRAARVMTRGFERRLRQHGIRIGQFSVLTALILKGPMMIGALADFLGVERTTLTRNLALIEAQGWVTIDTGGDARARLVEVTGAGRLKVDETLPAWREAQRAAADAIGPAGVAALQRVSRVAER